MKITSKSLILLIFVFLFDSNLMFSFSDKHNTEIKHENKSESKENTSHSPKHEEKSKLHGEDKSHSESELESDVQIFDLTKDDDCLEFSGKLIASNLFLSYTSIDLIYQNLNTKNPNIKGLASGLNQLNTNLQTSIDEFKQNQIFTSKDDKLTKKVVEVYVMLIEDCRLLQNCIVSNNSSNREKYIVHHRSVYIELKSLFLKNKKENNEN